MDLSQVVYIIWTLRPVNDLRLANEMTFLFSDFFQFIHRCTLCVEVPLNASLKICKSWRFVRYAIFLLYQSITVEKSTYFTSLYSFFSRQNLHKVCLSYFVVCFVFSNFWSAIKMQNSFMFSLFRRFRNWFHLRYQSLLPPNEYLA